MSDPQYLFASIAALVGALTTAYVVYRKVGPERGQIVVTTAEKVNAMTLQFAGRVGEENNELQREITELRNEFHQYRLDTESVLAELKAELRAEKAEKEAVKRENDSLKARVTELEAEVAQLKANGHTGG